MNTMNAMNLTSMTKESVLNDIETSKKKLEESITKAKLIIKQHGMDAIALPNAEDGKWK